MTIFIQRKETRGNRMKIKKKLFKMGMFVGIKRHPFRHPIWLYEGSIPPYTIIQLHVSNFSAFIVVLQKLSFDFWSWVLNLSSSSSHVMERESLCDQDILCWYPEISISESSSGDSVYRQYGDLSRRTVTNAEDEASVSVTGVTFTMLCMLTAARRCCTS